MVAAQGALGLVITPTAEADERGQGGGRRGPGVRRGRPGRQAAQSARVLIGRHLAAAHHSES